MTDLVLKGGGNDWLRGSVKQKCKPLVQLLIFLFFFSHKEGTTLAGALLVRRNTSQGTLNTGRVISDAVEEDTDAQTQTKEAET